jgi:hypothetical protein
MTTLNGHTPSPDSIGYEASNGLALNGGGKHIKESVSQIVVDEVVVEDFSPVPSKSHSEETLPEQPPEPLLKQPSEPLVEQSSELLVEQPFEPLFEEPSDPQIEKSSEELFEQPFGVVFEHSSKEWSEQPPKQLFEQPYKQPSEDQATRENMTGKKIVPLERPDDNARHLASILTLEEQVCILLSLRYHV